MIWILTGWTTGTIDSFRTADSRVAGGELVYLEGCKLRGLPSFLAMLPRKRMGTVPWGGRKTKFNPGAA